jgi:cobalt-zinc-cadmium efflux system outer membrane protein
MMSLCSIGCRTAVYLLAMAVATAALAAPAAPPSLTLDEAIRVALAGHPALRAAAQEVAGAQAAVQGAKALPSPEVLVTPAGTVDDSQLSLLQSLELNGQRSARTAAARARVSSAEAQWEAARQEIVLRRSHGVLRGARGAAGA